MRRGVVAVAGNLPEIPAIAIDDETLTPPLPRRHECKVPSVRRPRRTLVGALAKRDLARLAAGDCSHADPVFDPRVRGPAPHSLDHSGDGIFVPVEMSFDRAVRAIANPAADAELARLASEHRETIQFGVVFRGKGTAVDGPIVAAFEHRSELFDRLGISAVPYAIVTSPRGVVLDAQLTGSVTLLRQLVNAAVAGTTEG